MRYSSYCRSGKEPPGAASKKTARLEREDGSCLRWPCCNGRRRRIPKASGKGKRERLPLITCRNPKVGPFIQPERTPAILIGVYVADVRGAAKCARFPRFGRRITRITEMKLSGARMLGRTRAERALGLGIAHAPLTRLILGSLLV